MKIGLYKPDQKEPTKNNKAYRGAKTKLNSDINSRSKIKPLKTIIKHKIFLRHAFTNSKYWISENYQFFIQIKFLKIPIFSWRHGFNCSKH